MKYHLSFLVALIVILNSLTAQNKELFTISGTIDSVKVGNIIILTEKPNGNDTLCIIPIVDGKFKGEGFISHSHMAQLSVEGYRGFILFALSPGERYFANVRKNESGNIKSNAPLQKALQEYIALVDNYNEQMRDKQQAIDKARQNKKFRTAAQLGEEYEKIIQEARRKTDSITFLHKDDELGVYLQIAQLGKDPSLEKQRHCYEKLSLQAKQTPSAKLLASRIELVNKTTIGASAPVFKFIDKNDNYHSLSDIQAKLVIIDFWASWCGPCRKENPNLRDLYEQYKNEGLEIISISLDNDKKQWQNAVHKDKLTWLQLIAPDIWNNAYIKQYNIKSIPATFILDAEKRIIAKDLRHNTLNKFISDYFNRR